MITDVFVIPIRFDEYDGTIEGVIIDGAVCAAAKIDDKFFSGVGPWHDADG